ncbi:MAG: hypothetical protein HOW73_20545 [Polyangiaceae bacterium]|nr:hypothetical protein [Polyangiaceae bacterium]
MSEVSNARRYYLLRYQFALDLCEATSHAWLTKHDEEPGTTLPEDFPLRAELALAHYTTTEDLEGADVAELRKRAGLTRSQAEAVLTAAAAL